MSDPRATDDTEDPRAAPVVGILPGCWLTPSMTFVARQVEGVEPEFRTVVACDEHRNAERFPHPDLHHLAPGRAELLWCRLSRRLTGRWSLRPPWTLRRRERLLRRRGARLLHAHFGPVGLEAEPLARRLGVPLVVTFHGYGVTSLLRDPRYRRELEGLLRRVWVIPVSRLMAARLEELGARADRTRVVHCGIPTERFAFVERESPLEKLRRGETVRVLQVSNFVAKKGHPVALGAFARLASSHESLRLVLAGGGPTRERVEALAVEMGIRDRIDFAGTVDEAQVVRLMGEADVFVHHSVTAPDGDTEGLPTVIMEAMSRGLPVASSRHAAIPELIEDGVTGFLADEGDVEGCADALERALRAGPELARRASRRVARDFDAATQGRRVAELYREVLDVEG